MQQRSLTRRKARCSLDSPSPPTEPNLMHLLLLVCDIAPLHYPLTSLSLLPVVTSHTLSLSPPDLCAVDMLSSYPSNWLSADVAQYLTLYHRPAVSVLHIAESYPSP
eukprot:386374-Rhodomonas_salina.1